MIAAQVFDRNIAADMRISNELHALGQHLLQPPVENVLLHLEIRDAVTHQAADAVVLFVYGDSVSGTAQLLRGGQTRRSRSDHRHALSGEYPGRLRMNPTLREGVLDNGLLDLLDGHRRFVDSQHASGFARRGTDAAGEFGEVIRGVQHPDGFAPVAAVDQIVPIGNDIGERASRVAEWHAAIHAAGALRADLLLGKVEVDFKPILDALGGRTAGWQFPWIFEESGRFTHASPPRVVAGGWWLVVYP